MPFALSRAAVFPMKFSREVFGFYEYAQIN
jgi:hypothetical protein